MLTHEQAHKALLAKLKEIRESRYYFPFGEYNHKPVITAETRAALPPPQQSLARKLSSFDCRVLMSNYIKYETGRISITPDAFDRITDMLAIDITTLPGSELKALFDQYNALPKPDGPHPQRKSDKPISEKTSSEQRTALKAYVEATGIHTIALSRLFGFKGGTHFKSRYNGSGLSLEDYQKTLEMLGFSDMNAMIARTKEISSNPDARQHEQERLHDLGRGYIAAHPGPGGPGGL